MASKKAKTRRVEYYRLWGGDHGTWDTDFLEIPSDTPDDKLDEAVREAAAKIKWRDNDPPVIVGYYCDSGEEEEDDTVCDGCGQKKGVGCNGRPHCPLCDEPCLGCHDQ